MTWSMPAAHTHHHHDFAPPKPNPLQYLDPLFPALFQRALQPSLRLRHYSSTVMSKPSTLVVSPQSLPTELVDQIIDYLHDDTHALRTCSLLCRRWVLRARYHLFQEIKLTNTNSTAFMKLLRRSPHISLLVRTLNIDQDDAYSVPIFLNSTLPILAKKLTHLRTLRFSNIDFTRIRPEARNALLRQFSSIESLSLNSVTFLRFDDFASFIIGHPQLSNLYLRHIWWGSKDVLGKDQVVSALPRSYASKLQNITLSDTSYHIIEWLTLQYPSLRIRSLTHSTVVKCDIPALRNLLGCVGSSLEDLTISIHSLQNCVIEQSYITEPAMLLQNNSIRTLTLDNVLLLSSDTKCCAWIPAILSQIHSPCLEEIHLKIVWNAVEQLAAIEMERIDELLSESRFKQLKTFTIHSKGYTNVNEGRIVAEGRMERLSKRGILLFY